MRLEANADAKSDKYGEKWEFFNSDSNINLQIARFNIQGWVGHQDPQQKNSKDTGQEDRGSTQKKYRIREAILLKKSHIL